MMLAQLDLNAIESQGLGAGVPANPAAIIGDLLPYIFGAAGIALLAYLVFGGFQLMLSRGDPKAMQAAQGKMTNAAIGFVIIIVAFLLVQILGQLFGIQNTLFGQIFSGAPAAVPLGHL